MLKSLLQHSWLRMRRSPFFEKSLYTRLIIAFMVFFMGMQFYAFGRMLPGILHTSLPDRSPAAWAFGVLPLVLLGDLLFRFFIQKTPRQQVIPYLHLPISRKNLAAGWMISAWMHPLNFYLLFFFWPFIQMTINPATSSQHLGLLGIFLLAGINQSVIMLFNIPGKVSRFTALTVIVILALVSVSYLFYSDILIEKSLQFFLGFVYARPASFLLPLLLIALLHYIIFHQTIRGFYALYEAGPKQEARQGSNRWEQFLAGVPRYGDLWLLEWRLLIRNRRSKSGVYIMIPAAMAFAIYAAWMVKDPAQLGSLIVYIIMAGSLGSMQLQHAYSWDSHFFDFLASRNITMIRYVRAKLYFYLAMALLQVVLISLVTSFINTDVMLFFAALSLYACGPGFYFYLRSGIRHSSRFDPEGRANFNMEGISGMKFVTGLLLVLSVLPVYLVGFLLGNILDIPHGPALLTAITGIIFLINHRRWTQTIARRLEQRKHINLELYRQK